MDRTQKEMLRAQSALEGKAVVVTLSELPAALQYPGGLLAGVVAFGGVIPERMREHEPSCDAWRIQRGSALLLAGDLMADDD